MTGDAIDYAALRADPGAGLESLHSAGPDEILMEREEGTHRAAGDRAWTFSRFLIYCLGGTISPGRVALRVRAVMVAVDPSAAGDAGEWAVGCARLDVASRAGEFDLRRRLARRALVAGGLPKGAAAGAMQWPEFAAAASGLRSGRVGS